VQLRERIRKNRRVRVAIASGRRFITKDPVRFDGGYNLYAYVHNDPVNFFDRTGEGEEAFQDFFNKAWNWFNQLPLPAKGAAGAAAAAAANAAAPYVAGFCLISPLFLTTADTPVDEVPPKSGTRCPRIGTQADACLYLCPSGMKYWPKPAANDNTCPAFLWE
jgi:hypothetical protein